MIKRRSFRPGLNLLLVLVLVLTGFPASTLSFTTARAQPAVFINEIHYDNASTDSGEAIEIAGPAGTDLTGWSLVRYNGANGMVYATPAANPAGSDTLSGTIPDLGDGFGVVVVNYPTDGLQNGSPDGIALVDSSSTVVQFLSYEGSFTAVNGPAASLTSTDIGITESSSTPVGSSLQLTGAGSTYSDFTWSGPSASTFGAFNTGQTFEENAPVIASCGAPLTTPEETSASQAVSASDADGTVIGIAITGITPVDPGTILLSGFLPADGAGGTAMASVDVSAATPPGVYYVLITASNDDPEPQTGICTLVVTVGVCGDSATFIHEIQGSGAASPLVGTQVIIEGVVVGDFQNNALPDDGDLNGFYVQEEDGEADADPATSEGIFVFSPGAADVSTGDLVRVGGDVAEFVSSSGASPMTELSNISGVVICEDPVLPPAATDVSLPVSALADFERYEGMLVRFPQELVISEFFNFDRFNEIVLALPLAGQDRLHQPTAVEEPGPAAAVIAAENTLRRITLDDGRSTQNSDPAIHPNGNVFDLSNRFRGGDIVQNATGVIDDTFGLYRIHPIQGADYIPQNPRPAAPEDVGGSLKVASFNVLNYFLTLDLGPDICGPLQNQECRGADNLEEFERQRAKILTALAAIEADIFGLIEMENTTGVEPLADIVAGLNGQLGAGTYAYIDTGTIGGDAIKTGIIYKPGSVTPVGDYAILDSSVDPRFVDTQNRPVLAQTFMENATGGVVTVAVNHLKSKGTECEGDADPQQGNCNISRTQAAEALVDWLASDPTGSGDADFLIIGDLNAYDKEDPIDAVREGSDDTLGTGDDYTDLIFAYQGEFAYSYLFDAQLGYLDHALAIGNLVPQITGATIWHINADEPDILDYDTSFKQDAQDALYEANAYRSSDHDPVIVGLDLNGPPDCSAAAPSITSLWPANHKFTAIKILGVTDPDDDPITITIDSIFQDEAVNAPDSGNTAPDGKGIGTPTAQVRAERVGTGNGRVYHITFTALDGEGGSCSGVELVSVPISKNGSPAVDDGPLFDSSVVP